MDVFKEQLQIIKNEGIEFIHPKDFEKSLTEKKKTRKILFTVDDGLLSFYENAWPILKEKGIPFILFVNTREVGSFNYMNWEQILELYKSDKVEIGNHSHSHEYLVDENSNVINQDIIKSIEIFKKKLGKNSDFFSYPFGEYSLEFKKIVKNLGFKYAFGQHSGVIDETKDLWELPRFPINEKYGAIKRFTTLMKTLPFKYKNIKPEDRYLIQSKNPPRVNIEFHDGYKNNLNTHKSYYKFREKRKELREKNKNITGLALTDTLKNYAQTGSEYTKILNQIITQNRLSDFEPVRLVNSVKQVELNS